jgi:hypothetical protein
MLAGERYSRQYCSAGSFQEKYFMLRAILVAVLLGSLLASAPSTSSTSPCRLALQRIEGIAHSTSAGEVMSPFIGIYCSEAGVLKFQREGADLLLELENVSTDTIEDTRAVITFRDIQSIDCDGVELERVGMELPDGQMLGDFIQEPGVVAFFIRWDGFQPRSKILRLYSVRCRKADYAVIDSELR